MTAPTATHTDATPPVRLEPCPAFRPDHDAAWPECETCGWLEHDHDDPQAAGPEAAGCGTVTVLPRRVAPVPQRLAS